MSLACPTCGGEPPEPWIFTLVRVGMLAMLVYLGFLFMSLLPIEQ